MDKNLTCKECKKPFLGRQNRLYCSRQCRKRAEINERNRRNREKMIELNPTLAAWAAQIKTGDELWPDLPSLDELWLK